MQSLEAAVLVGFSLLIVFAAVPFLWQTVSASFAQSEARQYLAFMAALADSLQSDLGMAGVQRSFYLPDLRFGSLSVRQVDSAITCPGVPSMSRRFFSIFIWYNSSYILGGVGAVRGPRSAAYADLGKPVVGVNASSLGVRDSLARGYVLFSGPVVARTGSSAVVFVLNVTSASLSPPSISYTVAGTRTLSLSCGSGFVFRVGPYSYTSTITSLNLTVTDVVIG